MPFHSEDYGKDVVTLKGDDIFFLDTNIIISYLYKDSQKHEATLLFIRYLIYKKVVLCISEVVVMELLNGLAREFYVSDQVSSGGVSPSSHRRRWGQHIIKNDPSTLQTYHEKAKKLIEPFLDICIIVESDEEQVRRAFDISIYTPLGSADSLIVSSAIGIEALGLLSLDSDMEKVNELPVYTTTVKNDSFNGSIILSKLDKEFKNYLIKEIGDTEFNTKYPLSSSS
ncbi:type II toxin-antitoxin system VapC family toxin [Niallia sp. 01092]|uniref:type II toxin-antitoxin system VapC family toxin n=1 Tax=unclassified Niallia TaxID=2837522 RepID=UPI003FD4CE61